MWNRDCKRLLKAVIKSLEGFLKVSSDILTECCQRFFHEDNNRDESSF